MAAVPCDFTSVHLEDMMHCHELVRTEVQRDTNEQIRGCYVKLIMTLPEPQHRPR